MVQKVTDMNELDAFLKQKKTVIVKFMAEWCHPCQKISPFYEKMAK